MHLVGSVTVAHFLDGFGTVCYGCHDIIAMGDGWLCDLRVTELHSVSEAFAVGCLDVTPVGALMLGRSCQVPSID